MNLTLVGVISICICTTGITQDSLITMAIPSFQELESSLMIYTAEECDAQLTNHKVTSTKPWKELLPSIGLGYTVLGELRPSVSWSPLQILDRKERKIKERVQRESMILSCEVLKKERLHKLRQLYNDYHVDIKIMDSRRSTLLIDEELFAITQRKYDEHLIKPSEYLAAKRSIIQARSDLKVMALELEKLRNEVLFTAKVN